MAKAKRHTTSCGDQMTSCPSVSRRTFMQLAVTGGVAAASLGDTYALGPAENRSAENQNADEMLPCNPNGSEAGAQRLSLSKLRAWEDLGYGMFISFGMTTFVGIEIPDGKAPASTYNPDKLDVDQWIQIARDAGLDLLAAIPREPTFDLAGESGVPAWRIKPEVRESLMPLARIVWPAFGHTNGHRRESAGLLRGLLPGGHR